MTLGSQFLKEQMEILPELYKELLDEEEDTGKIWMPTTVNIEDKGMIFANGSGRDNWWWSAAKAVKGEDGKYKTNMSEVKHFKERDFMEALSYINVLPE